MIKAEIIIDAPSRIVRELVLDFPNLTTWHDKSFFLDLKVLDPVDKTTAFDVKPGDTLGVFLKGATFKPKVINNESHIFSWLGSIPYIFSGQHDFNFTPDPANPNRTLFSQVENFTGLLAFTMSLFGGGTVKGWEGFNRDLKVAAEAKWAKEQAGAAGL